jgi:CheY-like chemotaxis protein
MTNGRILIVDDSEMNLKLTVRILKRYDLNVETANSGHSAIEKIENGNVYDIIFMDYMMPEMNGAEAAKKIREMGYARPIIALSADVLADDIFLKEIFDEFITKPISIRQMDSILTKYINELPGVCIKTGLGLYEGDMEILTYAYRSFVKNVPAVIEKLRDVSEENLADYATNVHAVKGNSASIGAAEFAEKAAAIEKMAKSGDFDGVHKENASLINDAENLLKNINTWLAKERP